MTTLTKFQIEALKLFRKGKKLNEIRRIVKMRSPGDVIGRAQRNISSAIQTIELAAKNDLLEKNQIRSLKLIVDKL